MNLWSNEDLMVYELNSIQDERELRLDALKNNGKGVATHFLERLKEKFKGDDYLQVINAYDFAVNIDYDHVGLSSDAYLVHPLRVAEMVAGLSQPLEIDYVIIALLHNVLEVGGVDIKELEDKFGEIVSDSIQILTVDREQQWDEVYKKEYYEHINAGYEGMKIVKVIDKLDNMFMLGLNPDEQVRMKYLDEINTHVIPIAKKVLPHLIEYLEVLSEDAKQIGCFSNN
jgi:(p)ppGpp synthase/HD superfamily hydrolase